MFQRLAMVYGSERVVRRAVVAAASGLLAIAGMSSIASAATLCVSPGGRHGCKSTIGAAVAAAAAGDVVQVYPGTYSEQVVIGKSLSLMAVPVLGATIDATNQSNGIWVDGMAAAPNSGVTAVVIAGFQVRNANYEGILVTNASDVTLVENRVTDNNRSLDVAGSTCPGIAPWETNEGQDCGEGIHLMAADHVSVLRNEVAHNSGGILITDETGMSQHNLVSENVVHDNGYACGITMASHGPATTVIPTAMVSFGVMANTISKNLSYHNGTQEPGAGAGVGIFAPAPGTAAAGNVVIENELLNNGMPGVAMHNHAWAPSPAPGVNLNDNMIVGNHFSGNAADAADTTTSGPTGINIASQAPITGTVIEKNTFDREAIDVAFNAPSGQLNVHFNDFSSGIGVENLGAAAVDATENWWHCALGPMGGRCASAKGTNLMSTPWLALPFNSLGLWGH